MLLSLSAMAVPATFQYSLTDLGTFGGTSIIPTSINSGGQVVGYGAVTGSGDQHAFSWSGGSLVDLGTLGQTQSWANGINDNGVIVGQAGGSSVNTTFTDNNGTFTILPGSVSQVAGINNSGVIAGATGPSGSSHAITYSGGSITQLESSFSSSVSDAINNLGQVAGTYYSSLNAPVQGFLYSGGSLTTLGSLGGSGTWVYGLNDSGQVVGSSKTGAGSWDAYLYSAGSMVDLGVGGNAYGINDAGQVVGADGNSGGAFLYQNGALTLLNDVTDFGSTSFQTLDDARAINGSGQIVGFGSTTSGVDHAFLLTPIALTPVPEPATYGIIAAVLLTGLSAVRLLRRARRPVANR